MYTALDTATQLENGELIPENIKYFNEFHDDLYADKTFGEVEECKNTGTMHI